MKLFWPNVWANKFKVILSLLVIISILLSANVLLKDDYKPTTLVKQALYTIGVSGVAYAESPDVTVDGTADDVEVQAAIDDLPAAGGKIVLYAGNYIFTATVARALANVAIEGSGYGTYLAHDASTPLFDDGGQAKWQFKNFRTDAGGITRSGSGSLIINCWINTTFTTDLVDDSPSNGVIAEGISSNWAFDHNAADVVKSTYDAQTILQATTDDTPVALTVDQQTVVGRITGGNIKALTVAEIQTLILSAALPENVAIILDPALSAHATYSGIIEVGTSGETTAFGDLMYFKAADSLWWHTDANAEATAFGKLGIALTAGAAGTCTILLWGKVRSANADYVFTVGAPVFVSTTAGDVQVAAPIATGDIVRIVGYGNTADELYFFPDNTFVELL